MIKAEHSTFVETAYLLINGKLPTGKQLKDFSVMLNDHSLVHEDMHQFFENYPRRAHPMGILSSMVNALRAFYPEIPERSEEEEINITFARLLSKVRTIISAGMCALWGPLHGGANQAVVEMLQQYGDDHQGLQ